MGIRNDFPFREQLKHRVRLGGTATASRSRQPAPYRLHRDIMNAAFQNLRAG
jgi:hypothetical protein